MSEKPVRLQLSRKKGFDLQKWSLATNGLPAVNVARPSKFGNPFTVAGCRDAGFYGPDEAVRKRCVGAFKAWLISPHWRDNWQGEEAEKRRSEILEGIPRLRGKNLACWCGDFHCHANVLLELANRPLVCEPLPHPPKEERR